MRKQSEWKLSLVQPHLRNASENKFLEHHITNIQIQNITGDSYIMTYNVYIDYLYQGQHEYKLSDNVKINPNQQVGDYKILVAEPPAENDTPLETTEDDPYHVPAYFDLSETPTDMYPQEKEEVKLEFDPPLRHYAELRGGLPIGYVWIPPSSPEPIPREATPEQELTFVTPLRPVRTTLAAKKRKSRKSVAFDFSPRQEKRKRETTAEYQMRFTSPLSEELSDAPSGLLTPEPRELVLHRR
jgi:hypothetical protein